MLTMSYSAVWYADYLFKMGMGELSLNTIKEIESQQSIISSNNVVDEVLGDWFFGKKYEGKTDVGEM